jgi:serine/threonine-protein kinase
LFSEAEIVEFFQQILPVLDYIHRMGVVHRDISPDNIICRATDSLPILIDFGAVREAAAKYNHLTGTVIGKLGFAPDEQMRRGQVTPASDLYALAATALVLITGLQPYQLYNPSAATWDWENHTRINADLTRVFNKMLAFRAKDRYQSATEVLAALPDSKKLSTKTALLNGTVPPATLLSRLRTLVISPPGRARAVTPITTEVVAEAEWKKPAITASKTVVSLFLSIWAVTASLNWLQANNPLQTANKSLPKSFDPMKSINDALPKSFDPMKSINDALPKSFDPMKSINDALPKSFDPLKPINEAISGWLPKENSKFTATPQQLQAKRQAVQKQLKSSGLATDRFYKQVDRTFYQQHPELKNRPLKQDKADSQLRYKWWSIAEKMLPQQKS